METQRLLFTALSVIAPNYAMRVMQAKMMQRIYEGAQDYPTSDWASNDFNTSANREIGQSQKKLISRSRHLARNNPYAIKAQDVIVSNVVGTGIVAKITGRNKTQTKLLNTLWKEVAETKKCDIEGRNDFYALQSLAMNTIVESGEIIALKHITPEAPSLQLLEPDYIDSSRSNTGTSAGADKVVSGILVDESSRRKGYWIYKSHPGDLDIFSQESVLIPTDRVIHSYKQTRPGQLRGVPWAHSIIETLKDFADFQYATIVRQKISACLVGVITTSGNDTLLTNSQLQTKRKNETKMTPGSFRYANPGESVEFSTPPSSQGYNEFVSEIIRGVACGYGITYESISNDFSKVNFSSGRMGHIEMKRNVDKWRWSMLIPHFCDPYFELFLEWAKALGHDINGVKVEWVPPAHSMVDPGKEIKADKEAVLAGFKSKSMVIREQGLDPEMVRQEIKEEREADEKAGLNFDVYVNPQPEEELQTTEDNEEIENNQADGEGNNAT